MEKTKERGRPPKYKTPEQLQAAIDLYFDSCKGKPVFDAKGLPVTDRRGIQRRDGKPPTVSGLSLALGFKDRNSFIRQKNRSLAFNDVVLMARSRIEEFWESALYDGDTRDGALFMLAMCFGWNRDGAENPADTPIVRIIDKPAEVLQDRTGEQMAAHILNIHLLN